MAERYADLTVAGFLDALAARRPAPSGGAAAALTVASAAALTAMAARFARSAELTGLAGPADELRARLLRLADADAAAYAEVLAAGRALAAFGEHEAAERAPPVELEQAAEPPAGGRAVGDEREPAAKDRAELGALAADRGQALQRRAAALRAATEVPLKVARIGVETAELAARLAASGNPNLVGDARVAVLLAAAGVRAAAELVGINVRCGDLSGAPLADARACVRRADALARLD